MSAQPTAPPESDLIRQRRETAAPPLSRRQAAAKIGISPSQWSDIERGSKKAGQGTVVPIRATAETLARMAQAVEVSAAELANVGREDAADLLTQLNNERTLSHRLAAIPGLGTVAKHMLPSAEFSELLPAIAAGIDVIDDSDLPAATKRELTDFYVRNLLRDVNRRHTELQLLIRIATSGSASS